MDMLFLAAYSVRNRRPNVKLRSIKSLFSQDKYATSTYDLSNKKEPLDLLYSNFTGAAAIIPIERCRSHMLGFTIHGNPFVNTLKEYAKNKSNYSNSVLAAYYNQYCPTSMQSVLKSDNASLSKHHPMATVLPWGTSTPEVKLPKICVDISAKSLLSKEAHKLGLPEKDNFGWQFFGPVSEDLGLQEYQRLISVYKNIKNNGYKPEQYGYIHGQFLISDDDWVWVNIGGKHRFSSLAALEYKKIPVALRSRSSALFIRRSDVEFWPNVKNGLFSKNDALNIFDRILRGSSYSTLISDNT
ncbi:MAG: hypothetical protein ACI910_001773 [Oleispira sp.]|jgi:hypothetical protein